MAHSRRPGRFIRAALPGCAEERGVLVPARLLGIGARADARQALPVRRALRRDHRRAPRRRTETARPALRGRAGDLLGATARGRDVYPNRLRVAHGFAGYQRTTAPATEIPPPDVFPTRHQRHPITVLRAGSYSLLREARRLSRPLRAVGYEALFGLLAVSGMRVGEALALQRHTPVRAGGATRVAARYHAPARPPGCRCRTSLTLHAPVMPNSSDPQQRASYLSLSRALRASMTFSTLSLNVALA